MVILVAAAATIVLSLVLASDLSIGLIVLIPQVLVKPCMLLWRKVLVMSIPMSPFELIVDVAMLPFKLLMLRSMVNRGVSDYGNCKRNHRRGTYRRQS